MKTAEFDVEWGRTQGEIVAKNKKTVLVKISKEHPTKRVLVTKSSPYYLLSDAKTSTQYRQNARIYATELADRGVH